jgi:hypothetical protein
MPKRDVCYICSFFTNHFLAYIQTSVDSSTAQKPVTVCKLTVEIPAVCRSCFHSNTPGPVVLFVWPPGSVCKCSEFEGFTFAANVDDLFPDLN